MNHVYKERFPKVRILRRTASVGRQGVRGWNALSTGNQEEQKGIQQEEDTNTSFQSTGEEAAAEDYESGACLQGLYFSTHWGGIKREMLERCSTIC